MRERIQILRIISSYNLRARARARTLRQVARVCASLEKQLRTAHQPIATTQKHAKGEEEEQQQQQLLLAHWTHKQENRLDGLQQVSNRGMDYATTTRRRRRRLFLTKVTLRACLHSFMCLNVCVAL